MDGCSHVSDVLACVLVNCRKLAILMFLMNEFGSMPQVHRRDREMTSRLTLAYINKLKKGRHDDDPKTLFCHGCRFQGTESKSLHLESDWTIMRLINVSYASASAFTDSSLL